MLTDRMSYILVVIADSAEVRAPARSHLDEDEPQVRRVRFQKIPYNTQPDSEGSPVAEGFSPSAQGECVKRRARNPSRGSRLAGNQSAIGQTLTIICRDGAFVTEEG